MRLWQLELEINGCIVGASLTAGEQAGYMAEYPPDPATVEWEILEGDQAAASLICHDDVVAAVERTI